MAKVFFLGVEFVFLKVFSVIFVSIIYVEGNYKFFFYLNFEILLVFDSLELCFLELDI